jgi:hypothetical protein
VHLLSILLTYGYSQIEILYSSVFLNSVNEEGQLEARIQLSVAKVTQMRCSDAFDGPHSIADHTKEYRPAAAIAVGAHQKPSSTPKPHASRCGARFEI